MIQSSTFFSLPTFGDAGGLPLLAHVWHAPGPNREAGVGRGKLLARSLFARDSHDGSPAGVLLKTRSKIESALLASERALA